MQAAALTTVFHQGKHQEVVNELLGNTTHDAETLPLLIGSLCFLGRPEEAESFFAKRADRKTLAACRFYLGVGFYRVSAYEKGKRYFHSNLKEFKNSTNPLTQFYVAQGMGFSRYLECHYGIASRWAFKALLSSNEAHFLYGRYLASDLLGYTKTLSGKISEGLKFLKESRVLAEKLGSGAWLDAATAAILCYEAQFGLKPKTILKELDRCYSKLNEDLTYLKSGVLLEKARQLTLRGRIEDSNEVLNNAFRLIYSSKHKRQGVLLNLRLSENRFLRGEHYEALNLIRSTHGELDPKVDQQLFLSTKGMEKKLCNALSLPFFCKEYDSLTLLRGNSVAQRIFNRENGKFSRGPSEDKIAELLDQVARSKGASIDEIIQSDYLGFLFPLLPKSNAKIRIFPDLSRNFILVLENGNLKLIKKNHSLQINQLLKVLSKGSASKAVMVKQLWGYDYHPLRHDPLLYRLIGRTKKHLEIESTWLETTPRGYQLSQDISILFVNAESTPSLPEPNEIDWVPEPLTELNHRQLKILQILKKKDFLDVQEIQKSFKVSPITASRDLSDLFKKGKLFRCGKARATKYGLPNSNQMEQ